MIIMLIACKSNKKCNILIIKYIQQSYSKVGGISFLKLLKFYNYEKGFT